MGFFDKSHKSYKAIGRRNVCLEPVPRVFVHVEAI